MVQCATHRPNPTAANPERSTAMNRDLPAPDPEAERTVDSEWIRLRQLFSAAEGLSPAERTAFLDREVADEPALRGKLENLLQSNTDAGDFLTETVGDNRARMVGPYRLLQVLGEGGFGIVYLAEQLEPIHRRVALKLVRPGMDTQRAIGRFEAERQTLATLDHPGIARVLDAGESEDGRPYFAMEFVQGVPLTEFCERHDLGLDARLDLFLQVCDAIQHAHQAGVIHRDLKAANVLVTAQSGTPCPRVIDFGIAKATGPGTEENTATIAGAVLGTLGSMSPEQAGAIDAKVDTRSDIYSLGVLLFELLTGSPPFAPGRLRGLTWLDALQVIRAEDPPPLAARAVAKLPPAWRRELRGDLEWITRCALAKEPERRYASVSEFAADIRRHLANEPALAGAPGSIYRARKFMRRHRTAVGATAVLMAALLIGISLSTWGLVRARRAEQVAAREAAVAEAVNRFLNDDLLASVAPSARRGQGRDVLMREVLDIAAARIDTAAAAGGPFADEPIVEASIRRSLGMTYLALGEYAAAETHLRRAVALEERQPESSALAARLAQLGRLYERTGSYAEAERYLLRAIAVRRRVAPTDTVMIYTTEFELATVYRSLGRYDEAEQIYRPMLPYLQRKLGPDADRTLSCMNNFANLYQETGRFAAAETLQTAVLASRRRRDGDEDPATLFAMNNLANTLSSQGKLVQAQNLMASTLELKRRVFGPEHPSTLNSLAGLAFVQASRGEFAQAEQLYRETVLLQTKVLGAGHKYTLDSLGGLAFAIVMQGRGREALDQAASTYATCLEQLGESHAATIQAQLVVGLGEESLGRNAAAEQTLHTAAIRAADCLGIEPMVTALANLHLALVILRQGRCPEAVELLMLSLPTLPASEAAVRAAAGEAAQLLAPCDTAEPDSALAGLAAGLTALAQADPSRAED